MVIIIKIMMPAIKLIQVLSAGVQERAGYWLDRPGVPATICVKNGRVLAQIKKQTPANEMAKAGKAARKSSSMGREWKWSNGMAKEIFLRISVFFMLQRLFTTVSKGKCTENKVIDK